MSELISREEWAARRMLELLASGRREEAGILFAMYASMREAGPTDSKSDVENDEE